MVIKRVVLNLLAAMLLLPSCSRDVEATKRQYLQSGDQYVSQKKFREAALDTRNAVGIDPRFGEARLKLADTYAQLGDAQNALREYARAADLMPDNLEAQLKTGHLLLLGRNFEDAQSRADKVLSVDSGHVEAMILRANALAGLKDLEGAVAQLETAIKQDPSRALSYTNLGALQQAQGNREFAEKSYLRAVEEDPKSIEAQLALASFYWSMNRRADAEKSLTQTIALDPRNVMANRFLAEFYLASGRPAEAEQPLKVMADATPGVTGRLSLADYYLGVKRPAEAKAILERVALEEGGFAPARLRQSVIALQEGDRAAAYRLLDEILAKQPKNGEALASKADLQFKDGKPDEALAAIRAAIASQPSAAGFHFLHGRILSARNELSEAVAAYQEAVRLNPRLAVASVELARLNLALGKFEEALQFAQAALQVIPGNGEARLLLARAQLATNNVTAAEATLSQLSSAFPQVAPVQTDLGRLYLVKGEKAKARAAFDKAFVSDRRQLGALEGLVILDLQDGKGDAARARVASALKNDPQSGALLVLAGRTELTLKDPAAAERLLRQAVAADPNNLAAYRRARPAVRQPESSAGGRGRVRAGRPASAQERRRPDRARGAVAAAEPARGSHRGIQEGPRGQSSSRRRRQQPGLDARRERRAARFGFATGPDGQGGASRRR